jgi:hypothetical protein
MQVNKNGLIFSTTKPIRENKSQLNNITLALKKKKKENLQPALLNPSYPKHLS